MAAAAEVGLEALLLAAQAVAETFQGKLKQPAPPSQRCLLTGKLKKPAPPVEVLVFAIEQLAHPSPRCLVPHKLKQPVPAVEVVWTPALEETSTLQIVCLLQTWEPSAFELLPVLFGWQL